MQLIFIKLVAFIIFKFSINKGMNESDIIYNLYTEMAFGIAKQAGDQHSLNKEQFIQLLKEVEAQRGQGTNFFSVTQVTRVQHNKIPNIEVFTLPGLKYGKTQLAKVTQLNGAYNHDYAGEVNRLRAAEGKPQDFVAKASTYNAVEGTGALREKDGQLYLRIRPISTAKSFSPRYIQRVNGAFEVVNKDAVSQYIPTLNAGAYQGLDQHSAEFRMVSIDSIAAININGREYVITDLDPTRKQIWTVSGAPMPIPIE